MGKIGRVEIHHLMYTKIQQGAQQQFSFWLKALDLLGFGSELVPEAGRNKPLLALPITHKQSGYRRPHEPFATPRHKP